MPESDYLVKAISRNGAFRIMAVSTKNLTEEARERHNLSHTATVGIGRLFACAILLCRTLRKTKGHVILKIKGNGPLGSIVADASSEGTIRGYVDNPKIECFDKNGYVDIDQAVGKTGYVHIIYDNEKGVPYQSSTEIISGEIVNDVVNLLARSEQISSFISCGVYQEPSTGKVLQAGGILIQTLPTATEKDIEVIEESVSKLDPFSMLLRAGLSLEQIIKKSLNGLEVEIISEFEGVCFHCPCSQKKFESAIISLGKEEIKKIIETTQYAEGRCHFCNNIYLVTKESLEELLR